MAGRGDGSSAPLDQEKKGAVGNDQDNDYKIYKEPIN